MILVCIFLKNIWIVDKCSQNKMKVNANMLKFRTHWNLWSNVWLCLPLVDNLCISIFNSNQYQYGIVYLKICLRKAMRPKIQPSIIQKWNARTRIKKVVGLKDSLEIVSVARVNILAKISNSFSRVKHKYSGTSLSKTCFIADTSL